MTKTKTKTITITTSNLYPYLLLVILTLTLTLNCVQSAVTPTYPVFTPDLLQASPVIDGATHVITRNSFVSNSTYLMFSNTSGLYFTNFKTSLLDLDPGSIIQLNSTPQWNFDFAIRSDGNVTVVYEEPSPGDGIMVATCLDMYCSSFVTNYIPQPPDGDIFNPPNQHPSSWGISLDPDDIPVLSILYYDGAVHYAPFIVSCIDEFCSSYDNPVRFPQMSSSQANTGTYIGFDLIIHPNSSNPMFVYWQTSGGPTIFLCNTFNCASSSSFLLSDLNYPVSQGYRLILDQYSRVTIISLADDNYFNQTTCLTPSCSASTTSQVIAYSKTRSFGVFENPSEIPVYVTGLQNSLAFSLGIYASDEFPLSESNIQKWNILDLPLAQGWSVFAFVNNPASTETIVWKETSEGVDASLYVLPGPSPRCSDSFYVGSSVSISCISAVIDTKIYSPMFDVEGTTQNNEDFFAGATTLANGYTYLADISNIGVVTISVYQDDPLLQNPPISRESIQIATSGRLVTSMHFSLQPGGPLLYGMSNKGDPIFINCTDPLCTSPVFVSANSLVLYTGTYLDYHMGINEDYAFHFFYESRLYPQRMNYRRYEFNGGSNRFEVTDSNTLDFTGSTNNGHLFNAFKQNPSNRLFYGVILRQVSGTDFDPVYPILVRCSRVGNNFCNSLTTYFSDLDLASFDPREPWLTLDTGNVPIFGFSLNSSALFVGYCEDTFCSSPTNTTIPGISLKNTRVFFDSDTSTFQIIGQRTLYGTLIPHLIHCYDVRCSSYDSLDLDVILASQNVVPHGFQNPQLNDSWSFIFPNSQLHLSVMTGFSSYCPPGYFAAPPTCSPCTGATYKTNILPVSQCDACPLNSIVSANQTCSSCPSGSQPSITGQECDLCAAGYSTTGGGSCDLCPVGQFASEPGSFFCDACSTGSVSSTDRSQCNTCPPLTKPANDTCTPCPECIVSGIDDIPDAFSGSTPESKSDSFFIDIQENQPEFALTAQVIAVIVWAVVVILFLLIRTLRSYRKGDGGTESDDDPASKSVTQGNGPLLTRIDKFGFPSAVTPNERYPITPYMTSKFGGMITIIFVFTILIGAIVLLFGYLYDNAVTVESRQMGAEDILASSFFIEISCLVPAPEPLSDWKLDQLGFSGNVTSLIYVGETPNTLVASILCSNCSLSRSQSLVRLSSSIPTRMVNSYSASISLVPLDSGYSALPPLTATLTSVSPENTSLVFNGPSPTIISTTVDGVQVQFLNLTSIEGYHFTTEPRLDQRGTQRSVVDPLEDGVSLDFEIYRSDSFLLVQNQAKRSFIEFISQIGGLLSGAAFLARGIMSRYWTHWFFVKHREAVGPSSGSGSNSTGKGTEAEGQAEGGEGASNSVKGTHNDDVDVNLPVITDGSFWVG